MVIGAAGAGWAQYPGGGGSPGARTGRPGGPGPGADARAPAQVPADEQARVQLQELHEDLKLTPAQRGPWTVYATRVQQLADDVARHRNDLRFPKGPAPEQLDFVTETVRNRLTAMEDITDAGKALYATLTPTQKTIADDRLARISVPLIAPTQAIQGAGARGMPLGDGSPTLRGK